MNLATKLYTIQLIYKGKVYKKNAHIFIENKDYNYLTSIYDKRFLNNFVFVIIDEPIKPDKFDWVADIYGC